MLPRLFVVASLFTSTVAFAGGDVVEGVPVKIFVVDPTGAPVKMAVVRHPQEADRHRVNQFDGSWEATSLFMPDGTELVFAKGMELELEVSAAGYTNQHVVYEIRKRNNVATVTLTPMTLVISDEPMDEPIMSFGGDHPIDGAGTEPATPPATNPQ